MADEGTYAVRGDLCNVCIDRIAELEAENKQLLAAYRKRGVEIARLQLENNRLREALDWIEAEPEDPHKVQQRARDALNVCKCGHSEAWHRGIICTEKRCTCQQFNKADTDA